MTTLRKNRWLYLLALFQLVAGPLMLVGVTTLCKITVQEMPTHGFAKAVRKAWVSQEVQALVCAAADECGGGNTAPIPVKKCHSELNKIICEPWSAVRLFYPQLAHLSPHSTEPVWTPACPSAPPGTPPRLA